MRGQSLRPRGLVITEAANERLQMRIHMPLQTPIVHTRPRAVATSKPLLAFLLVAVFHKARLKRVAFDVSRGAISGRGGVARGEITRNG